ncbi:ATP-binding cassette domain-containing protein [Microbacterium sp. KUDC0406]|uniref:ATP-binding cassette domain-containing protein n=1 Tax=Microbacterium sp. KUDC0406 TaxID=2909588 RepID=UPI001F31DB27|nr:ATP-binding cassette domain-containing protein [Microbacterium sp. KUDC0406]UJP09024.1 ATP-binding cassette domain-containing protein [Microbacterium sp. KUDC0406]
MSTTTEPLVEATDIVKHFVTSSRSARRSRGDDRGGQKRTVKAVDGVTLRIREGEMFGLVGESGSGKTTFGQALLRMHEPTSGSVRFRGEEILELGRKDLRRLRPKMQYVFQDPFSALNPRLSIAAAIGEPMRAHGLAGKHDERDRVVEVLAQCGMEADALDRYPHEFSGGQRQRIVIARAMALRPEFVVADEPVSALDVSVQGQIVNLLTDLRDRQRTSFLFISHDLSVVEHMCTSVAIMYRGRIVEQGTRDQIFGSPQHPYTRELLAAVPIADPRQRGRRRGRRVSREWDEQDAPRPALQDVGDGHLVALPGTGR